MRALAILAHASSVIAEGEVLQLTRAHDLNLDQTSSISTSSAPKTAELFAASAEAGAVSAGADDAQITALRKFGFSLGMAFQLVDDALDYSGAAEIALGKNAGDDFREGKATLPLLLAVARTGCSPGGRLLGADGRAAGPDRRRLPPRPRTDHRHGRAPGDHRVRAQLRPGGQGRVETFRRQRLAPRAGRTGGFHGHAAGFNVPLSRLGGGGDPARAWWMRGPLAFPIVCGVETREAGAISSAFARATAASFPIGKQFRRCSCRLASPISATHRTAESGCRRLPTAHSTSRRKSGRTATTRTPRRAPPRSLRLPAAAPRNPRRC